MSLELQPVGAITCVRLGWSVERRPVHAHVRASGRRRVNLVLGAMHGDEPKSAYVAQRLIETLAADAGADDGTAWVVIPLVNPDGHARRKRRNARQVDINRNFPTENWTRSSPRGRMYGGPSPASEPETRIVIRAVETYRPARIVSIHSIDSGRHCNNYDGPGRELAEAMSRLNGYPVRASIGYPTPGSFGAWAGIERGIPTVTLELPSRESPKKCWEMNRAALLCLKSSPTASL